MCRLHVLIIADCTFALPSIWLWDSIYIYCWVQFANILLPVFVSVFVRHVGLQSPCAVSGFALRMMLAALKLGNIFPLLKFSGRCIELLFLKCSVEYSGKTIWA